MTATRTRQAANGRASATEELPDVQLPVDSYKDAAPILRRPFTAKAVRFKMQAAWPKDTPAHGLIVPYIDARLVIERLNLICPHLWSDRYEQDEQQRLACHLTVDGITRVDVGDTWQGKGLYSDAFKRAAVKFGIGVSLYAVPKMVLAKSDGHLKDSAKSLALTDVGEKRCRELYGKWLEEKGTAAFGQPFDHGDSEDSAGDVEVQAAEENAPRRSRQSRARTAALTAEPSEADLGPEASQYRMTALLAEPGRLKAKRAEAHRGMEFLGAPLDQQVRELEASPDARSLDALVARIQVALDRQAEQS